MFDAPSLLSVVHCPSVWHYDVLRRDFEVPRDSRMRGAPRPPMRKAAIGHILRFNCLRDFIYKCTKLKYDLKHSVTNVFDMQGVHSNRGTRANL
ncbi:hypothetical protein AVEN_81382-1 [Araneus ventricosus]|uniref:Uncharacterized protein n=1 Tax=Araneus ventricosus TaxID=182803 RepID=A0A4Y2B7M2_ARAVE|nr:hypothetical protein AVEN_81382-1 [Araneus ventricosus]